MENINKIRRSVLQMMHRSSSSHVGSCLSMVDILYVLYFRILQIDPRDPSKHERDRFILSKAHGSAALYAVLAARGFFDEKLLERYFVAGGVLPGHLDRLAVPGVETSGGSLGHGLPIGTGMALANMRGSNPGRVYVLVGDGECNEGSVWEAAMLAGSLRLSNLTVIVDENHLQGFGRTEEIVEQGNMAERWQSFGWDAIEVNGHDVDALEQALKAKGTKPRAVIARTIKGKGVSFMEDRLEWHYKSPNNEQLAQALKELE